MEIRRLQPGDERTSFRSGDPNLDRFFHLYAGQNQFRHHIGTTYVAVEDGQIVGYLTVAPGSLGVDGLPTGSRRGLPRYPLPILRLARLAVDLNFQRCGLGRELLWFVLNLALAMADDYGCAGIVADAKPGAVEFYERYGFQACSVVEGLSDERPQPTPMFLATGEIQAALRTRK